MTVYTDYESVNLSTGTRTRYVISSGERMTVEHHKSREAFERVRELFLNSFPRGDDGRARD